MAGIIGIPGRLQSVQAAAFARNPRPTSSECALSGERGHDAGGGALIAQVARINVCFLQPMSDTAHQLNLRWLSRGFTREQSESAAEKNHSCQSKEGQRHVTDNRPAQKRW